MSATAPSKPEAGEYNPYYEKYVASVREGDVLETLERQIGETLSMLRAVPEERGGHRYQQGKWSVKEVVGHMVDSERVFSYRALRFARGDRTELPGYEQDDYVAAGNFDARTLSDLASEFEAVRRATVALFRSLDSDAWARRGSANESEVSVRALAYIIAGHEAHHARIIRERYL